MGHLVNAVSTRIGWFETWKDEIYLNFYHQCDYVHHFIRIRYFLAYIFFDRYPWDDYIMIFSHFVLFKKRRAIGLIIYVYFGKIMLFSKGFFDYYLKGAKLLHKKYRLRSSVFKAGAVYKWILLSGLEQFTGAMNFDKTIYDKIYYFRKHQCYTQYGKRYLFDANTSTSDSIFKRNYINWKFYNTTILKFIGRISRSGRGIVGNKVPICRSMVLRIQFLRAMGKWTMFNKFAESMFSNKMYRKFISWYCGYISLLISNVFLPGRVFVYMESFDNNSINPTFLTRYMLRKLDQNFVWRDVLDPIMKELIYVMTLNKHDAITNFKNNAKINRIFYDHNKFYLKAIKSHLYTFNKYMLFNILKLGCFSTCIYSVFYGGIYKKYLKKKYFWKNAFILINSLSLNAMHDNWVFINYLNKNIEQNILPLFKDALFNIVLGIICKMNPFTFYKSYSPIESFRCINEALFLRLKYWRFTYKKIVAFGPVGGDPSKTRYIKEKNVGFEGFKLSMAGRLSRKERASSFWLVYGSVPLNTFSAHIDYAFFTIPLRNSAVTIKIWFNTGFNNNLFLPRINYKYYTTISRVPEQNPFVPFVVSMFRRTLNMVRWYWDFRCHNRYKWLQENRWYRRNMLSLRFRHVKYPNPKKKALSILATCLIDEGNSYIADLVCYFLENKVYEAIPRE